MARTRVGWVVAAIVALGACRDRSAERTAAAPEAATHAVEGTIARTDEGRVIIRTPGEPDVTLRVSERTRVLVDGQPSSLDRLEEGAPVRASYQTGSGRPTAVAIEARSAPAASDDLPRARSGPRTR